MTIPKPVVDYLQIVEGDILEVTVQYSEMAVKKEVNEREVLKWLGEARKQPPDWEMYAKVQTYVVDKAKALGMELQGTSINMEGLNPKAEQEVYEAMLDNLEWLWDCMWEKIREEQRLRPKKVCAPT